MKNIAIDHNTKSVLEELILAASVTTAIVSITYFVVVVWWVGLINIWHEEERLKHETCYARYGYQEVLDKSYTIESYCGEKVDVDN